MTHLFIHLTPRKITFQEPLHDSTSTRELVVLHQMLRWECTTCHRSKIPGCSTLCSNIHDICLHTCTGELLFIIIQTLNEQAMRFTNFLISPFAIQSTDQYLRQSISGPTRTSATSTATPVGPTWPRRRRKANASSGLFK